MKNAYQNKTGQVRRSYLTCFMKFMQREGLVAQPQTASFSKDGNPFARFADISPNRGISSVILT